MHLRRIQLRNFMSHEDTQVELPECGVVTVSGPNGHGKTALFREAPLVAIWGETMRGTPWWAGDKSCVRIVTDTLDVMRSKSGTSSPQLTWHKLGEADPGYTTTSKAQAALVEVVRSSDMWRRTHVLTRGNEKGFISGTDSERKEMLDALCGLEVFDVAHKQCKADLKESTQARAQIESQLAVLNERIKGLETRIADLREAREAEEAVATKAVPPAKLQAAKRMLKGAEEDERTFRSELEAKLGERAEAEADLAQREREAARLDRDNCPTCNQPIPPTLREELRAKVQAAKDRCSAVCAAVATRAKEIKASIAAALDEQQMARKILDQSRAAERDAEQVKANEARRAAKLAEAEKDLAASKAKRAQLEERLAAVAADVAELEVVERVLGLKGVRVSLMEKATATIALLTNKWLTKIFPGVTIELYEEKSKIQCAVRGIKHPYGYKGASDGQKKRLDVAAMFAFSEFSAARFGQQQGTLILDEVADSLDEEGLAAFSEAIGEIARDRCVVLITHNQTLLQGIRAVQRYHVVDGKVTVT